MKRSLFLLFLLITCSRLVIAQPVITFDKPVQHLGFIRQGDTLTLQYPFTNTGNSPLIITDTRVECGCTVVDKPAEIIMPGKKGILKVTFHSNGAIGRQDRTVTILSNASNSPAVLRFKCVVMKAKK